jgi:hypothetical protein
MAEQQKERVCWSCDEVITGEQIPRFDEDDPWQGPLTDDDYLCESCHDAGVDAWLDYVNTY